MDNNRSQAIALGIERTPNRAMLRAVGFQDEDFEKPIVGVANRNTVFARGIGRHKDQAQRPALAARRS
jgi:dihydroxy-acid dehydratase